MRESEKNFLKKLKESKEKDIFDSVKELFEACSNMINSFSRPSVEVIKEIEKNSFLTEQMNQISWYWIRTAATNATKKNTYDARNEEALKLCWKLFQTSTGERVISSNTKEFIEQDFMYLRDNDYPYNTGYLFSWFMMKEHRTLQQIFTGFVFTYLTKTNQDFCKMIKEIGEDRLDYMLMI